ncbi:hypothetical protein HDU98_002863 [Podochytrium sp. JEL0797]|nr:hypothetical protein HDU98_002863 [Podochytrium sp. JEL0797]
MSFFFQQLLGSSSSSSLGVGGNKRSSAMLLQPGVLLFKFQRAWDNIIVDYETESNWQKNCRDTDIPRNLKVMVDILVKEQSVVEGCTEKFLSEDMLSKLVSFSEADVPRGFRGEVIDFVSNLLLVLDPAIMVHNAVHRPLLKIIEASLSAKDYDESLLQLELDICGKIYDHPSLLHIFFSRRKDGSASFDEPTSPSLITGHDFIIFDHILQYIHDESVLGDFARESALFLVELAAGDLATYINVSEFAAVAIAGLCGVFSQLPQRIPNGISWAEVFKGHSISSARNTRNDPSMRLVLRPVEAFRGDVEALVRVLHFVQAVVVRCPNAEIVTLVLEDFQGTFLDNIVQSTLTGASDFDGTALSTLFYLQKMVETVKEECMAAILLQFLLSSDAVDEEEEDEAKKRAMRKSMHRRSIRPSSVMSIKAPASYDFTKPPEEKKTDLKLQVRDVLLSKLVSLSEEVVIATLNLLRTILQRHSQRGVYLLIERLPQPENLRPSGQSEPDYEHVVPSNPSPPGITISAQTHLWLVSRYFALIPADSPNPHRPVQIRPSANTSSQPLDLLTSLMDSFVSGGETVAKQHGFLVQGPTGVVPMETSLSSYVRQAEKRGNAGGVGKSLRARADVEIDEILLLGAAGGSKGNEAERRKRRGKKKAVDYAALTDLWEGEIPGILNRGSLERKMMIEVGKDQTVSKIMGMLGEFFERTFAVNLALTALITQLASLPIPLLYHSLFSADLLLGPRGVVAPLTPTHSLYTILLRLRRQVQERRSNDSTFDGQLAVVRQELFGQQQTLQKNGTSSVFRTKVDFDKEFLKNVVLLEEFSKELVGVLVEHGKGEYDDVSYIV